VCLWVCYCRSSEVLDRANVRRGAKKTCFANTRFTMSVEAASQVGGSYIANAEYVVGAITGRQCVNDMYFCTPRVAAYMSVMILLLLA
jgi:hypothetical protein